MDLQFVGLQALEVGGHWTGEGGEAQVQGDAPLPALGVFVKCSGGQLGGEGCHCMSSKVNY